MKTKEQILKEWLLKDDMGINYTTRAASRLDLIPEPKCFSQEFLSKHGDHSDMMLKKKI